jgi:hypothetical protein
MLGSPIVICFKSTVYIITAAKEKHLVEFLLIYIYKEILYIV